MRAIFVAVALLFAAPALGAAHSDADRYYACLVGNGAVELVNGSDAEAAFATALDACQNEASAAADDDGGDMGSATEAVEEAAQSAIDRLAE
jgi:hypothetical protein